MANDVHQLEVLGTASGQLLETIVNFEADVANSPTPQADSADLIAAWQGQIETPFVACLPADYSVIGYKAKRVNNSGGPSQIVPVTGVTGTRAGNATNTQVAIGCIYPYFSAGGAKPRWRVSKVFLPAIGKDDIVDNRPAGTLPAALATFQTTLKTAFAVGVRNWTYVLWSRKYTTKYSVGDPELGAKLYTLKKRLVPTL